jgi:hypothetical protein
MFVYCYDPITGAYAGEIPAEPSPLEPGEYLIPAFSTLTPPPPVPEGMHARMAGGEWTLEPVPAPPEPEGPGLPAPPPEAPEPTFEQRLAALKANVQEYLDAMARSLGYDDIKTAVTYAEEPAVAKFQSEGRALRAWRSLVWAAGYDLLSRVQAGEAQEPAPEELASLLPRLELSTLEAGQ